MKPITVRLEESTINDLDEEAEARGFANRTEYIRWMIHNRNGIDENTAAKLSEHEERIEELEEELQSE